MAKFSFSVFLCLCQFITIFCSPSIREQNENGPLPTEILGNNPRLVYLGPYNGRNWYVERTSVPQDQARAACIRGSMKLATFQSMDEISFINSKMVADLDTFWWTDGITRENNNGFYWNATQIVLPQMGIDFEDRIGLALSRSSYNSLTAKLINKSHFYLCAS